MSFTWPAQRIQLIQNACTRGIHARCLSVLVMPFEDLALVGRLKLAQPRAEQITGTLAQCLHVCKSPCMMLLQDS